MLFLGFGLPLAIYLLALALINRGSRAVMVPGTWDFAGVLFGVFGFLAFGGPAILLSLNEHYHRFLLRGGEPPLPLSESNLWLGFFLCYYLVIVLGAAVLIWRQRRMTAIYNVDPDVFGALLGQVLTRHQITFIQQGNVLYLRQQLQMQEMPIEVAERLPTLPQQQISVEVDPSIKFRHVTMRWSSNQTSLRQEIESELRSELENVLSPENPLGDWLLVVSGLLFLAMLLGTAALLLVWTLQRT